MQGAAVGVALWCVLFAFQLLPGFTIDTPGLVLFAVVGGAISLTPLAPLLLWALIAGAVIVLIVTESSISNFLASRWIRQDKMPARVDAVIVTSAGVNPNNTMNGEAVDHLLTGIELVRRGIAPRVVTSTVVQEFPNQRVASTADQARIIGLLAQNQNWIRTGVTTSTRDEALRAAQMLLPHGWKRVVVVSSPLHTRRACAAFEAVGFTVTCIPALARTPGGGDPGPWPADRLRVFGDWLYERLAWTRYKLRGWVEPAPARLLQ